MQKSHPAVLFRFHKNPDVCSENIRLLRALNPGVKIHGMFGGAGGLKSLPKNFKAEFDTLFSLPFEDPRYNWMNGDIAIRWWFKEFGHKLSFSHLCVVEWDIVYFRPLREIYENFEISTNYGAVAGSYQKQKDEGWPWIQGFYQRAFDLLVQQTEKKRKIKYEHLNFTIFGGCVLCRPFLEAYAQEPLVSSLSNDEVRLALYSYKYNIPLRDCGFLSDKRNSVDASADKSLTSAEVMHALNIGARAVHPVRRTMPKTFNIIIERNMNPDTTVRTRRVPARAG